MNNFYLIDKVVASVNVLERNLLQGHIEANRAAADSANIS